LSKPVNWVDPIVGARIKMPISSRLTATVTGDTGGWGVGSQSEYQMVGALSYKIKPRWAIDAAWRYLYSDYSQPQIHTRIVQSGIVLGVTYTLRRAKSAY